MRTAGWFPAPVEVVLGLIIGPTLVLCVLLFCYGKYLIVQNRILCYATSSMSASYTPGENYSLGMFIVIGANGYCV